MSTTSSSSASSATPAGSSQQIDEIRRNALELVGVRIVPHTHLAGQWAWGWPNEGWANALPNLSDIISNAWQAASHRVVDRLGISYRDWLDASVHQQARWVQEGCGQPTSRRPDVSAATTVTNTTINTTTNTTSFSHADKLNEQWRKQEMLIDVCISACRAAMQWVDNARIRQNMVQEMLFDALSSHLRTVLPTGYEIWRRAAEVLVAPDNDTLRLHDMKRELDAINASIVAAEASINDRKSLLQLQQKMTGPYLVLSCREPLGESPDLLNDLSIARQKLLVLAARTSEVDGTASTAATYSQERIDEIRSGALSTIGVSVEPDAEQPGLWVWIAPTDRCETSLASRTEALEAAWHDISHSVMGPREMTEQRWLAASLDQQAEWVRQLAEG